MFSLLVIVVTFGFVVRNVMTYFLVILFLAALFAMTFRTAVRFFASAAHSLHPLMYLQLQDMIFGEGAKWYT
jgi:hypothetical protein